MSLIKQLWLGIIIMLLLALGGSFAISIYSAKSYLQEQLQLKNIDNANSLALSMSQLEKDPVTIELLIAAQFDTGHYQSIILRDTENNVLVERHNEAASDTAIPDFFKRLAAIQVEPGFAQINDGWKQFGTLQIESQSAFAIESLWNNTLNLLQWFVLAAILSGMIGTFILKVISRPLDIVVEQAEAIGERRFITSKEPKTKEFQRLVRAMNTLSSSVKTMLDKETKQLEQLRQDSQLDAATGLYNREYFLNRLNGQLSEEDSSGNGILLIGRILNLSDANHRYGRLKTDTALTALANTLQQVTEQYPDAMAARLNSSDFILLIAGSIDVEKTIADAAKKIQAWVRHYTEVDFSFPLASYAFKTGQTVNQVMQRLDGTLAEAELKGNQALVNASNDSSTSDFPSAQAWKHAIETALQNQQLQLAAFTVIDFDGGLLHYTAPVRLTLNHQARAAHYFVPWAARVGLMSAIDLAVLTQALNQLKQQPAPLAITISTESLRDATFRREALLKLEASSHTDKLWVEFPEACVLRYSAEFREFVRQLKSVGCSVGLKHVGIEFTRIDQLQDMGLNYLKLDSAVTRNLEPSSQHRHFVQGLCNIGHSLGMLVIAEGVMCESEFKELQKLGLDGVTGPGVSST